MRQSDEQNHQMTLQAGLRTLHEAGPELKRAISGNLDDIAGECDVPMHRVSENKHIKNMKTIEVRYIEVSLKVVDGRETINKYNDSKD